MAAPENGRQLLLYKLPEISSNDNLLTTIIHDLFEKNDQVDQSLYELQKRGKFENLAKDPKLELARFESWCGSLMKFFDNVNKDLTWVNGYSVQKWNISILEEALKLVATLLELSKILVDTFDDISDKKDWKSAYSITNTQLGMTIQELVQNLQDSLSGLQGLWVEILENMASNLFPHEPEGEATKLVARMCSTDNGAPISAATLLELVLRNEIYWRRREFLRSLSAFVTEQEKLTAGAKFFRDLFHGIRRSGCTNKDEPAWAPKTLALVLDTASGIICVGGTQAVCNDIPILQGMTKEITRTRPGTAFKGIIDKCKENYREQMATIKTQINSDRENRREPKTAQQQYKMAVLENQPNEHSRLPTPHGTASLLCWAFNGYDFERVQPCLRCQRFYGKWTLYLSPETEEDQAAALQSGFKNSNIREKKAQAKATENACCAETVAAAKIYALRNGKLTLI